jgi:polar amino acid transport system substrate-binding protein
MFKRLPLLLTLLTFVAQSQNIVVATDEWEGYTNKDGTGYYFELIKHVFSEDKLDYKIVPYARSLNMLTDRKSDVVLGVYEGELPDEIYSKHIIEQDQVDGAISLAIAKNWKGISSLEGKKVVAKIDYAFDTITDVKMHYSEKRDLTNMLKMLQNGRVDAVLDYKADITTAQENLKFTPKYVVKNAILSSPVYFVFANTVKGKALKLRFDTKVQELIESGALKQMMLKNTGSSVSFPY